MLQAVLALIIGSWLVVPPVARALPVAAPRQQPSPTVRVTVRLFDAGISGLGPVGATIQAELRGPDGRTLRASGDATGAFFGLFLLTLRDGAGADVAVAPGDRLHIEFGGTAVFDLVVPDLTAGANSAADSVTGVAPANTEVSVSVGGGFNPPTQNTVAGADGAYSVSFAAQADIAPGTTGQVAATLPAEGIRWTIARAWGVTQVSVWLGEPRVAGVTSAGPPVTLVLADARGMERGRVSAAVDAGGVFGGGATFDAAVADRAGAPVPVLPTNILQYRRGSELFEVRIPVLTAQVDAAVDRVSGQGPAGAAMAVTVSQFFNQQTRNVTIDGDGRYVVDFAGQVDIVGGTGVQLLLNLPGGHLAHLNTAAASLRVWPEAARMDGTVVGGASVAVAVRDAGGGVQATGAAQANFLGTFNAELTDAANSPYYPKTGDRVAVEFGTTHLEMVVPALAIEWDIATNRVYGEATPGGTVTVVARPPAGRGVAATTVTANVSATGFYEADFAGQADLLAASRLAVTYAYPNGDRSRIDRTLPYANVQVGGNAVSGFALPRLAVQARLLQGETPVGLANGTAGQDQFFDVRLVGSGNRPARITAGQLVDVEFEARHIRVPVEALVATLDPVSNTVKGTGPVSKTLDVRLQTATGQTRIGSVTTDQQGGYSFQAPAGVDVAGGSRAEVGFYTADGHRLYTLGVLGQLVAYLRSPRVAGQAVPLTGVDLTLMRPDGGPLGQASTAADTSGRFTTRLTGAKPLLASGQRLAMTADGVTLEMVVANVLVTVSGDEVSGHIPPGTGTGARFVLLRVYLRGGAAPRTFNLPVNQNGEFAMNAANPPGLAPGFDMANVERIEAVYTSPEGHQTIDTAVPLNKIFMPFGAKRG